MQRDSGHMIKRDRLSRDRYPVTLVTCRRDRLVLLMLSVQWTVRVSRPIRSHFRPFLFAATLLQLNRKRMLHQLYLELIYTAIMRQYILLICDKYVIS
jgi:hypothetical protein